MIKPLVDSPLSAHIFYCNNKKPLFYSFPEIKSSNKNGSPIIRKKAIIKTDKTLIALYQIALLGSSCCNCSSFVNLILLLVGVLSAHFAISMKSCRCCENNFVINIERRLRWRLKVSCFGIIFKLQLRRFIDLSVRFSSRSITIGSLKKHHSIFCHRQRYPYWLAPLGY